MFSPAKFVFALPLAGPIPPQLGNLAALKHLVFGKRLPGFAGALISGGNQRSGESRYTWVPPIEFQGE